MAMWFGGDYNPEQWDAATVEEDIRLMREMHVNCVTLGVFSWVALEPEDGVFTFDWLEEIMDKLYANGIDVVLATPTDGMPNQEIPLCHPHNHRRRSGSRWYPRENLSQ